MRGDQENPRNSFVVKILILTPRRSRFCRPFLLNQCQSRLLTAVWGGGYPELYLDFPK